MKHWWRQVSTGMATWRRLSLVVLMLLCVLPAANAEERIALVIGNADYQNVTKLANPLNDAAALAGKLGKLGFTVTHLENLDRRSMSRTITTWLSKTTPEHTAVIYFAGHGIEIKGSNYLLPVDMPLLKLGEETLARTEAISLDDLLADVTNAKARRGIVILDACRNNPMAHGTRSVGASRGIARVDNPFGTFVMYAAGARQTALDQSGGAGSNGLFTQVLLKHLDNPKLELRRLAIKVRDEVATLAKANFNHQQIPSYYDQMTGDFHFSTKSPPPEDTKVVATVAPKHWTVDQIRQAVDGSTLIFGDNADTIYFSSKIKNTLTENLGAGFMQKNIRKDVVVQLPFLARVKTPNGSVQFIEGVGGIAQGTKKGGTALFLLQSTAADKTVDRFSATDRLFATLRFSGAASQPACARSLWRSLFGFKGKLAVNGSACSLRKGNHLVAN